MNIENLKYFIEVAKTGSLSKAAESLCLSQQGLSKAVKALERDVGARLLVRSNKGISLTKEGEIVLSRARAVVSELEAMGGELAASKADAESLKGEGIKLVTSLICLITIIEALQERGYLEGLVLRQAETERAFLSMLDPDWLHLVDMALYRYPRSDLEERYEVIPVFESNMGLITLRSAFPDMPDKISPEQASLLPLGIADTETTRDTFEWVFSEHPAKNVMLFTTSEEGLMRGVSKGRFAAFTISCQWHKFSGEVEDSRLFKFSELENDATSLFAFVRPKGLPMSRKQEAFVDSLLKAVGDMPFLKG